MKKQCHWQIICNPTVEILDRIIAPFRKRGIVINKFLFERKEKIGICNLEFETENDVISKLNSNLLRIVDVQKIENLSI